MATYNDISDIDLTTLTEGLKAYISGKLYRYTGERWKRVIDEDELIDDSDLILANIIKKSYEDGETQAQRTERLNRAKGFSEVSYYNGWEGSWNDDGTIKTSYSSADTANVLFISESACEDEGQGYFWVPGSSSGVCYHGGDYGWPHLDSSLIFNPTVGTDHYNGEPIYSPTPPQPEFWSFMTDNRPSAVTGVTYINGPGQGITPAPITPFGEDVIRADGSTHTVSLTKQNTKWGEAEMGTGATISWSLYLPGDPAGIISETTDMGDILKLFTTDYQTTGTGDTVQAIMHQGGSLLSYWEVKEEVEVALKHISDICDVDFVFIEPAAEHIISTNTGKSFPEFRVSAMPLDYNAYAYTQGSTYGWGGDVVIDSSYGNSGGGWSTLKTPGVTRDTVNLLYSTIVHEFCHSLGLQHTPVTGSLMYSGGSGSIFGNRRTRSLSVGEISGLQQMYGTRKNPNLNVHGDQTINGDQTITGELTVNDVAFSAHLHTYSSLTSIPSSFTPSSHTHAAGDLPATLSDIAYAGGSGTVTVPSGVTRCFITACGAGGGGGDNYGGGGGSGAYIINHPFTVTAGETVTFSTGNGGTAGSGTSTHGATGANTTFSGAGLPTVTLKGGKGGKSSPAYNPAGDGGAGGLTTNLNTGFRGISGDKGAQHLNGEGVRYGGSIPTLGEGGGFNSDSNSISTPTIGFGAGGRGDIQTNGAKGYFSVTWRYDNNTVNPTHYA
jgi:hypothetical protein